MKTPLRSIIPAALLTLLVASVSFAAQASRGRVAPNQLTNQYTQQELAARQDEQQNLEAKQTRAQLQHNAQDALQSLQKLSQQAALFSNQMEMLLDSDAGKRIVRHGPSFATYVELHNHPPASMNEIIAKTDAAKALVERLQRAEKGPDVGFVPSAKTQQEVEDLLTWAKAKLSILQDQTDTLDAIARTAPQDINLAQAEPLRTALQDYAAQWRIKVADYHRRGQELASSQVGEAITLAAFQAALDRANAEADRIQKENKAQIDKMMQEFELALLKQKQQAAEELSAVRQQYEDKLAQIQRDEKTAQTDRAIRDQTAAQDRNAKLAEARRQELIAQAKSPEVQQLLAPFLTPGYWQPGQGAPAVDKTPVSLNRLAKFGALRPTTQGMQLLLNCGTTPLDKDRPRWPYARNYARLTSTEHEELHQAQIYLTQLGSIMVELGLLAD